jgi:hypothetical protein
MAQILLCLRLHLLLPILRLLLLLLLLLLGKPDSQRRRMTEKSRK